MRLRLNTILLFEFDGNKKWLLPLLRATVEIAPSEIAAIAASAIAMGLRLLAATDF